MTKINLRFFNIWVVITEKKTHYAVCIDYISADAYFSNGLTETRMTRKYFHFFSSMFESWSFAVVHNNSWFPHKQHISINFYTVFVNKRYRAMRQNLKSQILKKNWKCEKNFKCFSSFLPVSTPQVHKLYIRAIENKFLHTYVQLVNMSPYLLISRHGFARVYSKLVKPVVFARWLLNASFNSSWLLWKSQCVALTR